MILPNLRYFDKIKKIGALNFLFLISSKIWLESAEDGVVPEMFRVYCSHFELIRIFWVKFTQTASFSALKGLSTLSSDVNEGTLED